MQTTISFGRAVCGSPEQAGRREWLVTNGAGGFASGTVAGMLTRRYHGLLIAALNPPLGRTLLLANLEETASLYGQTYPLFSNQRAPGQIDPQGYRHLERFHLEGAIPVWTFALADGRIEKRVWMQPLANTTYIQYRYARAGTATIDLSLRALVNYRDYHGSTRHDRGLQLAVTPAAHGLQVSPQALPPEAGFSAQSAASFYIYSTNGTAQAAPEWELDFFQAVEAGRGEAAEEDHLAAGIFRVTMQPGESITLVASTEPAPNLDGESALAERRAYEHGLLAAAGLPTSQPTERTINLPTSRPVGEVEEQLASVAQLVLAADQFIVRRASPIQADGCTILAGYPWFSDWGRDTMISLPGLALATGRAADARRILRTFSAYVDQGMLPNRFPDAGEQPEYNTVDATLWYFEALRAYLAAVPDPELLAELFPVLEDIFAWHCRGTRYRIRRDPQDGLLYGGEPGVQLTWMDVKIDDWVVTPRWGKPVEINALWYNALCCLAGFASQLGRPDAPYRQAAEQARQGFARFWNPATGYLYDVIDGPQGHDASLRPNQLLAVSLAHSPMTADQQRAVVECCGRALLTSHGLRSLAPGAPAYAGSYCGNRKQRDAVYHQGTVWAWLIGPFVSAHLRVYRDPQAAWSFVQPLLHHLSDHGLGTLSEIFDGDPPHAPHGCFAQAWSVAEVLRVWREVQASNSEPRGPAPA